MEVQIIEQDLYQWIVNSLESPPEENNGVRHYAGLHHYLDYANEPDEHTEIQTTEIENYNPRYSDCYVKLEKIRCPKRCFICPSCPQMFKVNGFYN